MKNISLTIICLLISTLLKAKVIVVDPGKNVTGIRTIKEAINKAAAGDTIFIKGDFTYREQTITISKPLVIIGIGRPVLDGEKKYEILAVRSNDVVIENLVLQNSGYSSYNDIAAIRIYNARNVLIKKQSP